MNKTKEGRDAKSKLKSTDAKLAPQKHQITAMRLICLGQWAHLTQVLLIPYNLAGEAFLPICLAVQ